MIKTALISTWDKQGVGEFAAIIHKHGYRILSTSKTADAIRQKGTPVIDIAGYAGSPEILGGRVKTLHPKIAGGILTTRQDPSIEPIDIVVCNLYPFESALTRDATREELVELIDIGGVTLLRAAAKNYDFVTAVPGPEYYSKIEAELNAHGSIGADLRLELAATAFDITSRYDRAIAGYLAGLK